MPVVTMPDGANVSFPEDMPPEQIKSLIAQKFPDAVKSAQPKKSTGILDAIKDQWDNPGPLSAMGIIKGIYQLGQTENRAIRGEFSPQPENPGTLTEEDAARFNHAKDEERRLAHEGAKAIMMGSPAGGIFGRAPSGAYGMGLVIPPRRPPIGSPTVVPGGAGPSPALQQWLGPPGPPQPPGAAAAAAAAPKPNPQEVVDAATRIGVEVPRYMVDERRMTQGMAAGLQNIPGAGDKIAKAADSTIKSLGNAANTVREGYGSGVPSVAGTDAKDAIATWITDGSKKTAEKLYSKVDELVDPAVTTELKTTAIAAQQILARRANAKIPGESGAVKTIMDAATTPGGMNYQGIKDLRSYIGEMTPPAMARAGITEAEAKQIYGALSADLRMSALNGGGAAGLTAFNKANRVYDLITDRREALAKIIGTKGDAAPEAVFARIAGMASNKTNADIGKLMQARKAIGPEAWDEVASAVVAKLGRDPQGEFSVARFLGPNGYGGLSDAGKNALFRSTGKSDLAKSLDDLAFVTKEIEDKLKKFYNPSGTAKSIVSTGVVLGVIHNPIATLSTLIAGNRMATVLSEPTTARAAADWAKAYHASLAAPHLSSRSKAVREAAEKLADLVARDTGQNPSTLASQLVAASVIGSPPTAAPGQRP